MLRDSLHRRRKVSTRDGHRHHAEPTDAGVSREYCCSGRSCLSRLAAFWARFHWRTAASVSGEVESATLRGVSSPNLPAAWRQPSGCTPIRLPSTATKMRDFSSPKPGQRPQAVVQLVARRHALPDVLAAAAVVGGEHAAQGVDPPPHRPPGSDGSPASRSTRRRRRPRSSPRSSRRPGGRAAAATSPGRGTPSPSAPAGRAASRSAAPCRRC